MTGYIYMMVCDGYVKIGLVRGDRESGARRLMNRLQAMQTGNPSPVKLAALGWVGGDVAQVERDLHREYATSWHRGEWFKLSPDDFMALGMRLIAGTGDEDSRNIKALIDAKEWGRVALATRAFDDRAETTPNHAVSTALSGT